MSAHTSAEPLNDVLTLICAADALLLRAELTRILWDSFEYTIKTSNSTDVIAGYSPVNFDGRLKTLVPQDVDVLLAFWRALNTTQQTMEAKRWSAALQVVKSPYDEEVHKIVQDSFGDIDLQKMAERVLRYADLRGNLVDFYSAYTAYEQSGWDTAQKAVLLNEWANLFAALVIPITYTNGIPHLRTLCLPYHYKGIHTLHATTDALAYKAFYKYARHELGNINCKDFREDPKGGIRSLNNLYFNNLKTLSSCGDHPAALLLGCRSGVQCQVLWSEDGQTRVIGMFALYFPFYEFWKKFSIDQADGMLLPAATTTDCDLEYAQLWNSGFTTDVPGPMWLTNIIVSALQDKQINVVDHLNTISCKWSDIQARVKVHGLPKEVTQALAQIRKSGVSSINTMPLTQWIESWSQEDEHSVLESAVQMPPCTLVHASLDAWRDRVRTTLEQDVLGAIIGGAVNIHKLNSYFADELWHMLHPIAFTTCKGQLGQCAKNDFLFDEFNPVAKHRTINGKLLGWDLRARVEQEKGVTELKIGVGSKGLWYSVPGATLTPEAQAELLKLVAK